MESSGPDIAEIFCYQPDGCCGPSPCDISIEQWICQIRTLLPEGDVWNNTRQATAPFATPKGAITVGCSNVGNQNTAAQLVSGDCCIEPFPLCEEYPIAPQLAVVDCFAAVAFGVVQALCDLLKELDPCTAEDTLRRWAEKFGIDVVCVGSPVPIGCSKIGCTANECSDDALAFLVCLWQQLKHHVPTWDWLETLAGMFGASIKFRYAGAFDCPGLDNGMNGPSGWWTMARDCHSSCPPPLACPSNIVIPPRQPVIPFVSCHPTQPESINLVICPAERTFPENCNFPVVSPQPHNSELYSAFLWLLPKLLPPYACFCVYECNPLACIE